VYIDILALRAVFIIGTHMCSYHVCVRVIFIWYIFLFSSFPVSALVLAQSAVVLLIFFLSSRHLRSGRFFHHSSVHFLLELIVRHRQSLAAPEILGPIFKNITTPPDSCRHFGTYPLSRVTDEDILCCTSS